MPRLSKIGAAALAAFGWSSGPSVVTASYLVVGGGGGGGNNGGGGGGAGAYRTGTASLNPTLSYTVTVGAGGTSGVANAAGGVGGDSTFNAVTSNGGGGGGGENQRAATYSGNGSGGGGQGNSGGTGAAGGTYGNAGGNGTGGSFFRGGGGGGASAAGTAGSNSQVGNGGNGTTASAALGGGTYAGGGGGSQGDLGTGGAGGTGGGGSYGQNAGTANLGGGGGGGNGSGGLGGAGGSGIVIISYAGAQQFGGGVVTSVGGNTIHTFTTSGTLSPITSLTANFLVVAGGGGASSYGGGGAGGYRTSAGTSGGGASAESTLTIDTNSIYVVTVGGGGVGGSDADGTAGSNSSFLSITSTGGGFGGNGNVGNGGAGGSGGGGGWGPASGGSSTGGSGTANQGFNGGTGQNDVISYSAGGGGGGASAAGTNAGFQAGGIGGNGVSSSITGSAVTRAGGGGGRSNVGTSGAGGSGGGGQAYTSGTIGGSGTVNTGSGGGGGQAASGGGGAGGSGVVIISYPGSTAQMSGGTVTIVGGNVIHTFTSSGFLSPIVLLNRSLRFRSSASAYLNRTPASAGNRQTWTWSAWVKRGTLGAQQYLFQSVIDNSGVNTNKLSFFYNSDNTLNVFSQITVFRKTNAVFRDPAAWYHIVLVADTNNATANNRFRLYINNVEQTYSTINNPSSGLNTAVNAVTPHYIASEDGGFTFYDGYLTEINFIDGQALTPSSFGSFNAYGSWSPVRYGGSYGTNGFYLPFSNNASTTTLGLDFSPNGNNWTTNNISLTAGSTYDSMTDVPTLTSATAANYAVLNPLVSTDSSLTYASANLNVSGGGSTLATRCTMSTIAVTSGKWYAEMTVGTTNNGAYCGVIKVANLGVSRDNCWNYYDGLIYPSGAGSFGTAVSGNVIGIAFDADNGTVQFYKNGSTNGAQQTGLTTGVDWAFYSELGSGGQVQDWNFGQRPFAYTPPSGFVALNTYNL